MSRGGEGRRLEGRFFRFLPRTFVRGEGSCFYDSSSATPVQLFPSIVLSYRRYNCSGQVSLSTTSENISRSRKVSAIKQTRLFEIARNYTTEIKGVAIWKRRTGQLYGNCTLLPQLLTRRYPTNPPMGVEHCHPLEKNEEFSRPFRSE